MKKLQAVLLLSILSAGLSCPSSANEESKGIEPAAVSVSEQAKKNQAELLKLKCRDYVIARETIDHVTEEKRWAEQVKPLSSEQVWTEFLGNIDPKRSDSLLKEYKEPKATRSVKIITTFQGADDVFLVDWESTVVIKGGENERKRWRSTLKVDPVRFTVVKYDISSIASPISEKPPIPVLEEPMPVSEELVMEMRENDRLRKDNNRLKEENSNLQSQIRNLTQANTENKVPVSTSLREDVQDLHRTVLKMAASQKKFHRVFLRLAMLKMSKEARELLKESLGDLEDLSSQEKKLSTK